MTLNKFCVHYICAVSLRMVVYLHLYIYRLRFSPNTPLAPTTSPNPYIKDIHSQSLGRDLGPMVGSHEIFIWVTNRVFRNSSLK